MSKTCKNVCESLLLPNIRTRLAGVDAREWLYIQDAPERMSVLLIQAKVARLFPSLRRAADAFFIF
jgi:hypothetical protein